MKSEVLISERSQQVINDLGQLVYPKEAFLITKKETNDRMIGFTMTFRTYSLTFENGGTEITIWVKGVGIETANMFLGDIHESKKIANMLGAEICSYKTNNKVPVAFKYNKMKSILK